jgi:hypothetical protein
MLHAGTFQKHRSREIIFTALAQHTLDALLLKVVKALLE